MLVHSTESLLQSVHPLGFRVRSASARSLLVTGQGSDIFTVEARALAAQQKEMILSEGRGSVWRLSADEGPAMKGHDSAPFPLGYLIAGVSSDLHNRIRAVARRCQLDLGEIGIGMSHVFGASGSFVHSTATASSESSEFHIDIEGRIDPGVAAQVVAEAMAASPAITFLHTPMSSNTFALYINGRRRKLVNRAESDLADVSDPFLKYARPPQPGEPAGRSDLIERTEILESGDASDVPLSSAGKRLFKITGYGRAAPDGVFTTETQIAKAGMRHFILRSDESESDAAPSGLGLLAAGIAACYLTQLHRYIEAQKLPVHGLRLVQHTPFTAAAAATVGAIDTHLFLNGDAPEEVHRSLLTIAADTCFMHAAAAGSVKPRVTVAANGVPPA